MSDKYKNIDDLFKDKFKDFELDPPEHVWTNVKASIHGTGKGGAGSGLKNGGIYGLTIFMIVTALLTLLFLSSSREEDPQSFITSSPETEQNFTSSPRTVEINVISPDDAIVSSDTDSKSEKTNKKESPRFDISQPATVPVGNTPLSVIEKYPLQNTISYQVENQDKTNTTAIAANFEEVGLISAGKDEELLAIHQPVDENVENESNVIENNPETNEISIAEASVAVASQSETGVESVPEVRSDYGSKGKWMFGVFFTPEMIFYPDNNNLNNRSYALDVNAIYSFSGYFIQSGLGVSWVSDEGRSRVDYNRYLGSYDDVYNVTFDTVGNELIPIYHTETVRVYDSIDHVSVMPSKSHFTYLQIPVLFGYGKENRRFGWFVKGGPSLSILIHKNLSSAELSNPEDKIVHTENDIPSRINTNWQFLFTAGMSYKLSNNFSLTAEPVFRYYLNSTYVKNSTTNKNPYSVGLRVGFLLDF